MAVFAVQPERQIKDIVTFIPDADTAQTLPCGATIGDTWGGRSFNNNIAAVLESRSDGGWHEVIVDQERWTVIVRNR